MPTHASSSSLVSDLTPFGPVNVGATERMVTAGLGGALLLAGLAGGPASRTALGLPLGVPLGLVGGVLLLRAVTGHCPAYQALGVGGRGEPMRLPPPERFGRSSAPDRQRGADRGADVAEVLGGPHPDRMERTARTTADEVTRDSEYSFPASDPPGWRDDR